MAESQNIEWKESRDVRRVRKIAQAANAFYCFPVWFYPAPVLPYLRCCFPIACLWSEAASRDSPWLPGKKHRLSKQNIAAPGQLPCPRGTCRIIRPCSPRRNPQFSAAGLHPACRFQPPIWIWSGVPETDIPQVVSG